MTCSHGRGKIKGHILRTSVGEGQGQGSGSFQDQTQGQGQGKCECQSHGNCQLDCKCVVQYESQGQGQSWRQGQLNTSSACCSQSSNKLRSVKFGSDFVMV